MMEKPKLEEAVIAMLEAQAYVFDLMNDEEELKRWQYVLDKRKEQNGEA